MKTVSFGSMWYCAECGQANNDDAARCAHCGASREGDIRCPGCGSRMAGNMFFCPNCGRKAAAGKSGKAYAAKKMPAGANKWFAALGGLIAVLAVAVVLVVIVGQKQNGESLPEPSTEPSEILEATPQETVENSPDGSADAKEIEIPPAETENVEDGPVKIDTAEALMAISDDLAGEYVLSKDIDMSGYGSFAPIGSAEYSEDFGWSANGGFMGTLDGNGYTIRGLEMVSTNECLGLFAAIGNGGVVKGLSIECEYMAQVNEGSNAAGAIAGVNEGTIENCKITVNGTGEGPFAAVGGIVGINKGSISQCRVEGGLQGLGDMVKVGGIAGINLNAAGCAQTEVDVSAATEYLYSEIGCGEHDELTMETVTFANLTDTEPVTRDNIGVKLRNNNVTSIASLPEKGIYVYSLNNKSDLWGDGVILRYGDQMQVFAENDCTFNRGFPQIASRDLDGDGREEIVFAHCRAGGADCSISEMLVFKQTSEGTYSCAKLDSAVLNEYVNEILSMEMTWGSVDEESITVELKDESVEGRSFGYEIPWINKEFFRDHVMMEIGDKITVMLSVQFQKEEGSVYLYDKYTYVCDYMTKADVENPYVGTGLYLEMEVGYNGSSFVFSNARVLEQNYDTFEYEELEVTEYRHQDYSYIEENGGITIKHILDRGEDNKETIAIPETIDGKQVLAIGDGAFNTQGTYGPREVILPYGLKTIGEWAFCLCSAGTTIEIPETVTYIAESAFEHMNRLEKITIPEGITEIKKQTFLECYGLEEVTLPSTLRVIGASAFGRCRSLKRIDIPEGVTTIEDGAFHTCDALRTVCIPASLTSIGDGVFDDSCVEEIILSPDNTSFVFEDGVLKDLSGRIICAVGSFD